MQADQANHATPSIRFSGQTRAAPTSATLLVPDFLLSTVSVTALLPQALPCSITLFMSTDPPPEVNTSSTPPVISQAAQLSHASERARRGHSFQGPYASGHADQHNGDNIYYYNR